MKRRVSTMQWLEANRELLWDLLRVYLGFALVVKGIVYMLHRTAFAHHLTIGRVDAAGRNASSRPVGWPGASDYQAPGQQSHRFFQSAGNLRCSFEGEGTRDHKNSNAVGR